MVKHKKARSFEISKLKNLLEKLSKLLRSLELVIHQTEPASEPSLNTRTQNVSLKSSQ